MTSQVSNRIERPFDAQPTTGHVLENRNHSLGIGNSGNSLLQRADNATAQKKWYAPITNLFIKIFHCLTCGCFKKTSTATTASQEHLRAAQATLDTYLNAHPEARPLVNAYREAVAAAAQPNESLAALQRARDANGQAVQLHRAVETARTNVRAAEVALDSAQRYISRTPVAQEFRTLRLADQQLAAALHLRRNAIAAEAEARRAYDAATAAESAAPDSQLMAALRNERLRTRVAVEAARTATPFIQANLDTAIETHTRADRELDAHPLARAVINADDTLSRATADRASMNGFVHRATGEVNTAFAAFQSHIRTNAPQNTSQPRNDLTLIDQALAGITEAHATLRARSTLQEREREHTTAEQNLAANAEAATLCRAVDEHPLRAQIQRTENTILSNEELAPLHRAVVHAETAL